jgi:hypothetical protein
MRMTTRLSVLQMNKVLKKKHYLKVCLTLLDALSNAKLHVAKPKNKLLLKQIVFLNKALV